MIRQDDIILKKIFKKMIWDMIEENNFNEHFKDTELTVERLLLDENILTEMQSLNPKLLDYIENNQSTVMQKLIEFVTVMPKEEEGYDRCHRLPYISSEMLAIDNRIFHDAFFPKQVANSQFLDLLLMFLQSEARQNCVLMGYFQKVMSNLYKGNKQKFCAMVSSRLSLFSKHLNTETVGCILKDSVILLNTEENILVEERKQILNALMDGIVREKESRNVCSRMLVEVIGKFQTFSSGDELLQHILSSEKLMLAYKLGDDADIAELLCGILIKSTQKKYDIQTDSQKPIFTLPPEHLTQMEKYILMRLPMMNKVHKQNQQLTVRKTYRPHAQLTQYFQLVRAALQNHLHSLLQNKELVEFVWVCFQHYKNCDILQVILTFIITHLIQNIPEHASSVIPHIVQLYSQNQRLYRPHLFLIWKALIDEKVSPSNPDVKWDELCKLYQQLLPLYEKSNVKKAQRPANARLIIDEEEMAEAKEKKTQESTPMKSQPEGKKEQKADPFTQFSFWSQPSSKKPSQPKEEKKDPFADFVNFGK